MKKITALFLSFLFISACGGMSAPIGAEKRSSTLKVLLAAPQFTLPDKDDNAVKLRDYRGKVILLFFTATWCPHCRKAVPDLNALYENYRNKGFVILSIFVDDAEKVKTLAKTMNAVYPILIDDRSIMKKYGVIAIPEFLLIDRVGRITKRMRVGLTFDVKKELSGEIEDLL
ncbi:MAG: TlpA family protein disulfide reductase [Deltaproteobacteria bacterium]|nr:TlpA family protein disulfide reductase [Deltaproteobacteria bacterium]MBN2688700.1 TlpA family protein disulfide reductase [Deltaproteobacteria bacterium]